MYLEHFSLREAPFSITPDSAYFYPHESVQAAFNTVLVALRSGEGFMKIVGEVGCGKTVLCRQLLKTLHQECVTAYIPNPGMGPDDLLMALAQELKITLERPLTRHGIHNAIRHTLLRYAAKEIRVVLFIDEAQAMPVRTLESVRLLSNLETEKSKLLQLVLLGQPELDTNLALPEIRQLMQRITFSEYIGALPADKVGSYVMHRLRTAALGVQTNVEIFDADAIRHITHTSRGVPRLINIIAHKCLMLAYGEGVYRVTRDHARMAAKDTPGVVDTRSWWQRLWSRS